MNSIYNSRTSIFQNDESRPILLWPVTFTKDFLFTQFVKFHPVQSMIFQLTISTCELLISHTWVYLLVKLNWAGVPWYFASCRISILEQLRDDIGMYLGLLCLKTIYKYKRKLYYNLMNCICLYTKNILLCFEKEATTFTYCTGFLRAVNMKSYVIYILAPLMPVKWLPFQRTSVQKSPQKVIYKGKYF